ncbi:toll/interleukin-1 receptor domain-containing protein [Gimesia aquarii]|uniref:TIR domain-containing protein n=1 Tax=Gimesia aquarii TaxID=2527964 RepID=A0A517X1B9_9PLAN|nr:toll/interleukin-1 receptor domain-containing protein [Gimesia aquarii]QDU11294.1 hypothetical protein V202x_47130 [Gimesia aquarii]
MKVFISWSGNRSRAVAEMLKTWIKCVLQATRPWLSTRDIDRGALWFSEIHDQLKDTAVGIVCLTKENQNRPWILFESGALAKGLSSSRVCTFLIDLEPSDIVDPLAQFNHTIPNRDSVWELVRTLNKSLSNESLDDIVLDQVFDTYWGQFEKSFAKIIEDNPQTETIPPRPDGDILVEILENTRGMQSRLRRLESREIRDDPDMQESLNVFEEELLKELFLLSTKSPKDGMTKGDILHFFRKNGVAPIRAHKLMQEHFNHLNAASNTPHLDSVR